MSTYQHPTRRGDRRSSQGSSGMSVGTRQAPVHAHERTTITTDTHACAFVGNSCCRKPLLCEYFCRSTKGDFGGVHASWAPMALCPLLQGKPRARPRGSLSVVPDAVSGVRGSRPGRAVRPARVTLCLSTSLLRPAPLCRTSRTLMAWVGGCGVGGWRHPEWFGVSCLGREAAASLVGAWARP